MSAEFLQAAYAVLGWSVVLIVFLGIIDFTARLFWRGWHSRGRR